MVRNRATVSTSFSPEAAPQGLLVFVHGGYWLRFDREMWSHLAAGAVARGWACAVPSYTLAPEARIGAMTREIASAVEVAANLTRLRSSSPATPPAVTSAPGWVAPMCPCQPSSSGSCRSRRLPIWSQFSDGDERRPAPRSGRNSRREPCPTLIACRRSVPRLGRRAGKTGISLAGSNSRLKPGRAHGRRKAAGITWTSSTD